MTKKAIWLVAAMALSVWGCDSTGRDGTDESAGDTGASGDEGVVIEDHGVDSVEDVSKDIQFADLIKDNKPPEVVSTDPADEEGGVPVPFTIKVTFNEGIRFKETVDKNTFMVRDIKDKEVPGDFTYDDETFTVTFTPDAEANLMLASPYRVTLKSIIQDKAGNGLKDWYYFGFSTALPSNLEGYRDLAEKYSPIIYQAVKETSPLFDYLTSFDFDGNWKSMDNYDNLKTASEVPSWVYYDVVETKSHYFIRYAFFWPFRWGVAGGTSAFANDVSGATVVVAKYPSEKPLGIMTYFSSGSDEEIRSYTTEEADITGDYVNWSFPEAQLFPGGHYLAYLAAMSHESCLWIHTVKESPTDFKCQLTEGLKTQLKTIRYSFNHDNGTADSIKKGEGGFPNSLEDVKYGLKSLMADWWVRRDHVGEDSMFTNTYIYDAPDGRMGNGLVLPKAFLDPYDPASSYNGRLAWAWKWAPSGDYYDMPRGVYFLDPAYFFAKRHYLSTLWNPGTKMGFSLDYCFNQYLLIDQRELDPECQAAD